ncbi:MAG: DNA polymerase III subunit beta [Actinomycetes bacterium]
MKFRAEREALADAVAAAQRAVAARPGTLAVLGGLKVGLSGGTVEFVGSDLELTIRVSIAAAVEGEGNAILPAKLFGDLLARLDADTVSVDFQDNGDAKISAGRFETVLRTLSADDFPRLSDPGAGGVTVSASAFSDALRQVVPAASRDDSKPILTGVLLTSHDGGLRLVATDSYRLAMRDLPGVSMLGADQRVLVSAKALAEVQRIKTDGDLEVVLEEREVTFRLAGTSITSRLIDGQFPDYQKLIPDGYPNRLVASRDALGAAVGRVRLVGQGRDSAPITLRMSADGVECSAMAQDVGEATEFVDGTFNGDELKVAFNAQYLLDGLEALGTAEVAIETIEPLKPAVMRSDAAEGFFYLLMPVRIS